MTFLFARGLLAGALSALACTAGAAVLEGFETPELAANTHQYNPTGSGWTFAGVTGAGLQRNGSPFKTTNAPQGVQTAFLKSNDGSVSRSVTLAPGVYRVSFWTARRGIVNSEATAPGNPVQVFINGTAVGTPFEAATKTFTRVTTTATYNVPTHGNYTVKLQTTKPGDYTALVDGVSVDLVNPFDALYGSSFQLPALNADLIQPLPQPATKASGLNGPSYIDPAYGTRVYRATTAADFTGAAFVRHEYSRRQVFNANNTRYLANASNGNWLVYDADTFLVQRSLGMGGSCEPIWHPTDPNLLWHTTAGGGMKWFERNVVTDASAELMDFSGPVKAVWPTATAVWTRGEGTSSADGRYFAFMATHYDGATQTNQIKGLFTWDRLTKQIIGTLDASLFNGVYPDHISITPSGKYAVPSWDDAALGTRAYALDFSGTPRQLLDRSSHSDLAVGPDGQDYFVVADYVRNQVRAIDVATGGSFDLFTTLPRTGSSYAMHISGQAFDKPGWAVISTYHDYHDYDQALTPDTVLAPMYRKIILAELKPGGKRLSVAHTRAAAGYGFDGFHDGRYFGEHQASISRDGSRLIFATNFDTRGAPSSYVIGLPSWVYTPSAGGTTPPPAGTDPLAITLGQVTRNGYSGSFTITSNVAAACRMGTQDNVPYAALYDNMTASADGKTHTKATSFGTTGPQTVYVRCISNANASDEKAVTVNFP